MLRMIKKLFAKDNIIWRNWDMSVTIGLTVAAYLLMFGLLSLNIYNTDFVVKGGDFTVSYLGSVFYRLDEWRWPIFTHMNLAYPYGISVHGTDGSPLLALIFKVLHKVFGLSPEVQFVGVWMFFCYILQAIASVLIFRHAFKNKFFVVLGALFFVSAPIMMMRVFVHINLMCHFIVLFTLLLYLNNRLTKKEWIWMGVLFSFAILTCPYFLPIISGFFAILIYQKYWIEKQIKFTTVIKGLLFLTGVFLFWFYLLGMVSTEQNLASGGWRGLSLNLTALFNPIWSQSRVFSSLTPSADFDADNYFGFGLLILLCICFPSVKRLFAGENLKRHYPLAILLLGLTLFALSSQVKLGTAVILDYKPGEVINWLGNVFRYSGRFFWPVWYLLAFFIIKTFVQKYPKGALVFLPLLLCVQIWDLYPTYKSKHDFIYISPKEPLPMVSKEWERLDKQYPNVFIFAHNENYRHMWRWAIKHRKNVNYGFLNRPSKKTHKLIDKTKEEILSGYVSDKSYFYLIDQPFMKTIESSAKNNPDVAILKEKIKNIDGFLILEYDEELMKERQSFKEVKISVKHRYWEDVLTQISKYRVSRDVEGKFTDFASIVKFDDTELILKWDKYGIEEFEKKPEEKQYHQRDRKTKDEDENVENKKKDK